jgi:hypothetical protein
MTSVNPPSDEPSDNAESSDNKDAQDRNKEGVLEEGKKIQFSITF